MKKQEIIQELKKGGAGREVIAEIGRVLCAYGEVNVVRNCGNYSVSASVFLDCFKKGSDYKVWFIKDTEWYTEDERVENYINEFCDFPDFYKGRRSYIELNKVSRDIRAGKVAAKMIGGEIKFVKAA